MKNANLLRISVFSFVCEETDYVDPIFAENRVHFSNISNIIKDNELEYGLVNKVISLTHFLSPFSWA